jgi:hypothetical protein
MKVLLLAWVTFFYLHAADWVMIQGIQAKPSHKLWGFTHLRTTNNEGDILVKSGINKTPFSYVGPDLEEQKALQIARLRIGLRGALDKQNRLNYFLLTEFGKNGISQPLGYYQKSYLTDASITFKHLPVFIRMGKFKYAGSEEGQMARFTSPFIYFTTLSNQLMLERFVDSSLSKPGQSVGAYRDVGVQLFQNYKMSDKQSVTFAYMLGNGRGLDHEVINSDQQTHYFYTAYQKNLGKGRGYHREAIKLYGWYQKGKRLLQGASYDRLRYGLGGTYFADGLRIEAEYMRDLYGG